MTAPDKQNWFFSIDEYKEQYPTEFGTWKLDFDPLQFLPEAHKAYNSSDVKIAGRNDFNKFKSVDDYAKDYLTKYWNDRFGFLYDWKWEYFHSGEPAGLHTDYTAFPNVWKVRNDDGSEKRWQPDDPENSVTHDCTIVLGIIIPLEWNCKQPYTVSYNRVSDVPRKLLYRKGEVRYTDTNEVYPYRDKWEFDEEVLKYNPKGTEYYKEYADLKVDSVFEWKVGDAVVFDTARWHSSSWFLNEKMLPDVSTEYKRSIIGFASIDIDKDLQ